jgi:hypothetical protein
MGSCCVRDADLKESNLKPAKRSKKGAGAGGSKGKQLGGTVDNRVIAKAVDFKSDQAFESSMFTVGEGQEIPVPLKDNGVANVNVEQIKEKAQSITANASAKLRGRLAAKAN